MLAGEPILEHSSCKSNILLYVHNNFVNGREASDPRSYFKVSQLLLFPRILLDGRWSLVSAQLSNKFGICPSCTVIGIS